MRKIIVGIGIFLIIVGLIGITSEIKAYREIGGGGTAENGGPSIPNWLLTFLAYQALIPVTMICTGTALIQIGRDLPANSSSEASEEKNVTE